MVEKKDSPNLDVAEMLQENYVPSESERKRVLLYYFLLGIIITLTKNTISKYEFFHLRQAIGWWTVFFLVFIVSMLVIFIPWIRILPILAFIVMFIIWLMFIKQAWEGKYIMEINNDEKIFLPFFLGIGGWMLDVFDTKFDIIDLDDKD